VTTTLKKPQRSARKPKGDGHLRRGEILQAAERIFIAEGYQGATIRRIADEVGVSSTALYMHFRDKDEILLEICDGAIEQLLRINTEISAQPIDAVTRVRLMLDAYMDFALASPNAYQLVFCGPSGLLSDDKQQMTRDLGDRCYDKFVGVVREIGASGRLRTGNVESAAQTLWTACHGLVALLLTRPTFNWEPRQDLKSVMLDGLLYGLMTD
jgi:AcrR family transcriptional regulator